MKAENEILKIEKLRNETIQAITSWQAKKVKSLFKRTEQIYVKGSDYTKSIIANSIVYPITHLLEMNYSWGKEYLEMLPLNLKAEYHRQIYSSGI